MAHQANDFTKLEIATHPGRRLQYGGSDIYFNDGDDDQLVMMGFMAQDAEDLEGVKFRVPYQGGTSPYFKFELWPLSGSTVAAPDMSGTVLAETAAFQVAASTEYEIDFTSAYSASQGEALGVVLKWDSGTVDSSNYAAFKYLGGGNDDIIMPFVSWSGNDGVSWSISSGYNPTWAVTTNKLHDEGFYMISSNFPQFILDEDGDRLVNKLVMPTQDKPMTLHCNGARYHGNGPQSGDTAKFGIWQEDGTFLGGVTWDAEYAAKYPDTIDDHYLLNFTSSVELVSGGTYYIGWERISDYFQAQAVIVTKLTTEADALKRFRSWPMRDNYRMFAWDTQDASPAFALHDLYPYSRLLIDLLIEDMHGQFADSGGGGSTISAPSIGVIG